MSKFAFFHKSGALTCDFFLYCGNSKRKNSKRYGFTILDNSSLSDCKDRALCKVQEKDSTRVKGEAP